MDKIRAYFDYATERSLKTGAQTALSVMTVGSTGLFAVDWVNVISVSGLAMVMSLLTSVLQYDRKPSE